MRGFSVLFAVSLIAVQTFGQAVDRTGQPQAPTTEKGEVKTPGGQAQPSAPSDANANRLNGPGSAGTSSNLSRRPVDLSGTKNGPAPENGVYSANGAHNAQSNGTAGKND